ncbi:MAG TPA: hypothetical protein DCG49_08170 [Ruminococcus sp.]|nr:hypothetical protein [Ruminococcus sp.]
MQKITQKTVNIAELLRCAESGEECSFDLNGKRHILYSWGQCDGIFLNIADENGVLLWQAIGRSRSDCVLQLRNDFGI